MKENPALEIEMIESSGGVFEITVDGELLYSKMQLGRFPHDDEIASLAKR